MGKEKMNRVLLIDVMSEAFRAFHALPKTIVSTDGVLMNALLGFHNSVRKLIDDFKPTICLAAWSCSGPTFRHELFKEYKSNRSIPDALVTQKTLIIRYLNWIGIPQFSCDRFEADDILATLATHLAQRGYEVIIDTVDKDLWSLCAAQIKIWAPREKMLIGHEHVMEKFRVMPNQISDLLALIGDKTDNVRRVPGVSERTAIGLLNEYGDLRSLLDKHLSNIPSPQRERIEQSRNLIEMNLQLTHLCKSVPLDVSAIVSNSELLSCLARASAHFKTKDLSFLFPPAERVDSS